MNKKVLIVVSVLAILLGGSYFMWVHSHPLQGAQTGEREVTHELGTVKVTNNPSKIVAFDYGTLDILDSLGVKVTGVAKASLPDYLKKYQGDEYEDIGTLFEPNYEVLAKIAPDIIFISGRQKDAYNSLSEIAPTVYLTIDATDYLSSFRKNVEVIGQIVNQEKAVAQKLDKITTDVTNLKAKVESKRPTGLILLTNQRQMSVYGQGSRFGVIHNAFGIVPIDTTIATSTHGQSIGYEYIVAKNPDYIFVVDRNKVVGGGDESSLFENDLMKNTKAYQEKHIIFLDPEVWYLSTGGIQSTEKMIAEISAAVE